MPHTVFLTDRFERAFLYACQVHGGQLRKGTDTPYVAHLMAVAATVLEYGGDEDLAIAALLHDSAEDQGGIGRLRDIEHRFGPRVCRVVASCSDSLADTHAGEVKPAWELRKQAYIEQIKSADTDVLQVSLADKVHNARSILRDVRKREVGATVWSRFSQPRERTLWYYGRLADAFCDVLGGREPHQQLAHELREIVDVLKTES